MFTPAGMNLKLKICLCSHIYLKLNKELKHKTGVYKRINWIHSHSVCACNVASDGHSACLIASGSQILIIRVPDLSCIPLYCAVVKVSTI